MSKSLSISSICSPALRQVGGAARVCVCRPATCDACRGAGCWPVRDRDAADVDEVVVKEEEEVVVVVGAVLRNEEGSV